MARSLRIPGLLDLVRVDARSDIRILANDARLDRRFDACGPLINRILVQRIRSVLRLDAMPIVAATLRSSSSCAAPSFFSLATAIAAPMTPYVP